MKEAYKQKQIIIDEIKDKFERAESAVVIDYMGITVAEADEMRKKLREAEVDYTVYKNTLVKRAIEGTKYEALGEILEGPSGFAFSYDDATAPARVLNDAKKLTRKWSSRAASSKGNTTIKRISKRLQRSHPEIHSSPSSWEAFSPQLQTLQESLLRLQSRKKRKNVSGIFIADCMNRFKPQIVCGQ